MSHEQQTQPNAIARAMAEKFREYNATPEGAAAKRELDEQIAEFTTNISRDLRSMDESMNALRNPRFSKKTLRIYDEIAESREQEKCEIERRHLELLAASKNSWIKNVLWGVVASIVVSVLGLMFAMVRKYFGLL